MKLKSLKDTQLLSKKFSKILNNGDNLLLYGKIGVGKTTFVRSLVNNFEKSKGVMLSQVLSPTFNIVFKYSIKSIQIMHYDFYRINKSSEIGELGVFSDENDSITIIEWPELLKHKPKNRIEINFKYLDNFKKREIKIRGFGNWKNYDFKTI
tara:strand:+ start:750 stop:1205 length:456 start_codon:yes stop_codon:yes gene_type:complete